jgi:hypothetical protein
MESLKVGGWMWSYERDKELDEMVNDLNLKNSNRFNSPLNCCWLLAYCLNYDFHDYLISVIFSMAGSGQRGLIDGK